MDAPNDRVRARFRRQLDVVGHVRGSELDVDRNLPISRLAQLFDLDDQVVRTDPIRMANRAALVDPRRQLAHVGDLF